MMSTPNNVCFHLLLFNLLREEHPYPPSLLLPSHTSCVMKMDHHCPWINVCIGHHNHAAFTRFIFCTLLGCLRASLVNANFLYRLFTGVSCFWSCCSALAQSTLHCAESCMNSYVHTYLLVVCMWLVWVDVCLRTCVVSLCLISSVVTVLTSVQCTSVVSSGFVWLYTWCDKAS